MLKNPGCEFLPVSHLGKHEFLTYDEALSRSYSRWFALAEERLARITDNGWFGISVDKPFPQESTTWKFHIQKAK